MAIEVFHTELSLALLGFVQGFDNVGAGCPDSTILAIDIFNKDGQALSSVTQLGWAGLSRLSLTDHDASVAEEHLRAGNRLAIAEVFAKTEHASEPADRLRKILINEVREENVGGDGTVLEHWIILGPGPDHVLAANSAIAHF